MSKIGNTPLIELKKIEEEFNLYAKIFAKDESKNQTGSIKDRAALYMINDAEERGIISKGATIIEPTSGNTGIAISAICRDRGYKAIIVMPDSMSKERIEMMEQYGAEVILTPGSLGMDGSIKKAEELNKNIENSFIPSQFTNPANIKSHYETTGPEIIRDLNGKVDILVSGIGSGGTITGTGKYLKETNNEVKILAYEPEKSPLLSKGVASSHGIQGVGANFIPDLINENSYDEIVLVSDEEAIKYEKILGDIEGLKNGISSGAALSVAIKEAQKEENKGKNIVVILPDSYDRYKSMNLF